MCILGDFDQAILFDPEGFSSVAEPAVFWARAQLEHGPSPLPDKLWDFIGERPRSHKLTNVLFVHGSPRNPMNEYVYPEDIYNHRKMEKIFNFFDRICFAGHTRIPGIWTEDLKMHSPEEVNYHYELPSGKTLVNVGAVGIPADGDPRACYVIFDGRSVRFRRVEYDVAAVVKKIQAIPELDDSLVDCLQRGREMKDIVDRDELGQTRFPMGRRPTGDETRGIDE
jgi:hypothetical protein